MPATALADDDLLLAQDMGRFFADPLGFIMYAYPWDTDPSLQLVKLEQPWRLIYGSDYGPDRWACEALDSIGKQVKAHGFDGRAPVDAIREAIASGHGIGKSALVAWIVDWIMSTRPYAQGTVTASTAPQLETKTWAQIAKWTKLCITGHWFDVNTGRGSMKMTHKQHPEKWFCSAQTAKEENAQSFAGQHAANSTSFYLFDEASEVPDKIKEVADGGLTDGEPMMFAFGNPVSNTGWFRDCFYSQRHRWNTRQIDSRDVQITNKKMIQEMIDDYGIDSDRVKVRVRGMFPAMSAKQFITTTDVDAAFGRHLHPQQYQFAAKILTLDNAWEGDDEGVIGMRQGLRFDIKRTFAKNDNDMVIGKMLADLEDSEQADAVFIDGGFGTGVVSYGRTIGRNWILVWFNEKSSDPGCVNKRAEMYKLSRDWLKEGGAIPGNDHVLYSEAISAQIVPRPDGKLQIESKKDMKHRGVPSPNRWDSLILSHAHPVQPKYRGIVVPSRGAVDDDFRKYDPLADV